MLTITRNRILLTTCLIISLFAGLDCLAQLDPERRNLIELGYDQPLAGQGPQAVYAYYYYNNPEFVRTNVVLRLAVAPVYLDGELGFKQLISRYTDVGIGFSGGLYGDEYYEVRQGKYLKRESFDGHDGDISLSIYQLLDPGMLIPLNLVARGGFRYSAYEHDGTTDDAFETPGTQPMAYTRVGLRFAGKEPVLYPDLGLEMSVWYQRQWRFDDGEDSYGYAGDRQLSPATGLYWAYAGMNYTWTNSGQKVSFAVTAGGSTDPDRLNAWRLGGVLPLVSEFPLIIPGYYYEELTAKKFVHLYAAYEVPLDPKHLFKFKVEGASANVGYLPGYEQPDRWQSGAGCALTFAPPKKNFQIVVRYGYGFNALRHGEDGAQSVGLLFQYDFGAAKKSE
jgi:hypothetical protein